MTENSSSSEKAKTSNRQSPQNSNTVIFAIIALIAVIFVSSIFYRHNTSTTISKEDFYNEGVLLLDKPRAIESFSLNSTKADTFTNNSIADGKWRFLFFGYTNCPDICPLALAHLSSMEKTLNSTGKSHFNKNLEVIFVSVDPQRDSLDNLKKYVESFSSNFLGVSSTKESLANFASQLNAAFEAVPNASEDNQENYLVNHTGNIIILNPKGHYHGFIKQPHTPDQLVRVLINLIKSW